MRNWRIPATALAVGMLTASASWGQAPGLSQQPGQAPTLSGALNSPILQAPDYRYPVTPQAGEWLICVQSFKETQALLQGEQERVTKEMAQALAEEMAEYIQRSYKGKYSAYVYERGHKERAEEERRIEAIRQQQTEINRKLEGENMPPVSRSVRYRTTRNPYEFAVFVGKNGENLKKMEDARDLLKDLRKEKSPPEKFACAVVGGNSAPDDRTGRPVERRNQYAYLNPFLTAMVAHNPTIELARSPDDARKEYKFMKALNSEEEYSALKCTKPYTLLVKMYQGLSTEVPKGPTFGSWMGFGKKPPEALGAAGAQAHEIAKFLRTTKPSFEAYVLHCRQYSLVSVGQYDSPDDPNLIANQKTLAGLQMKAGNIVFETLNSQPVAMQIPR